jgi:hypothetical protein
MAFCLETEVTKILNSALPFDEKMKEMSCYNHVPGTMTARKRAGHNQEEIYQDAIIHLLRINLTLQLRILNEPKTTIQIPVLKLGDLNAKTNG